MTGVGMENARITAELALGRSDVSFAATLYCGVAGSVHNIGDVVVPESWTADGGDTWLDVDDGLLRLAADLAASGAVELPDHATVGDSPAQVPGAEPGSVVTLPHAPRLRAGGRGSSSDPFGGMLIPCVPGGGDVLGCAPGEPPMTPEELDALLRVAFADGVVDPPAPTTELFAAQDMETAAVARVAARHGVPFVGIRAVSDGQGDPLDLPGFPSQFFAYRHLAADNAAAATRAVLERM
jgi:hypothetical protein